MDVVAELLAKDYAEHWWANEDNVRKVETGEYKLFSDSSPLKIDISNYFTGLDINSILDNNVEHEYELQLLSDLNVDGIITTNWDLLINTLFPDYETYIGQRQLLFANPQGVGEIYKIHGCVTLPESLVLTNTDYTKFNELNPYLAAKLITIFVEHPIVFIGYSTTDSNIQNLILDISKCLDERQLGEFQKNLIFVRRLKNDEEDGYSDSFMLIDGRPIPYIEIKTNDFSKVYSAINETKRKIPSRILRLCKEQLYELVLSAEPEKQLRVIGFDNIESKNDIDFVVGFGVMNRSDLPSGVGYKGLTYDDIIDNYFDENDKLDAESVLRISIPDLIKRRSIYIPIYKYLQKMGVCSQDDYNQSGYKLNEIVSISFQNMQVKQYITALSKMVDVSFTEFVKSGTSETVDKIANTIPCFEKGSIDNKLLREFIIENREKLKSGSSKYCSVYRKLVLLYDKIQYGWD